MKRHELPCLKPHHTIANHVINKIKEMNSGSVVRECVVGEVLLMT